MTEMTLFRDRDVTTLMMALTQHFRATCVTPTFCPANAEIHLLPFEADSAALRDCERRVV
jgi:hypothetical protein